MRTVNWPLLNVAFRMTGNPQGLEECMEKAGLTLGDYWEESMVGSKYRYIGHFDYLVHQPIKE